MAVSQIEERILGRLARQAEPSNPLLSASLYQVLGLSILLSRKLFRARKLRRLDITRDTKSLQLYHHIIWLAREGLSITEVYILPYCQDGEQGPECRVMAAKLRASLYHVFCLFHNHPPVSAVSPKSGDSASSPSSTRTVKADNGQVRRSPGKSPRYGREAGDSRRRAGKLGLRDPIPSIMSDTSYITNPYSGPAQTPPPVGPPPPIPIEARRTPTRPPGLTPINVSPTQAAASFLLPPLNFVPMAREHFDTAQHLATSLLPAAHPLRLSVSLEHAAFLWDCEKEYDRSRRLARRTIKEVYTSTEGLDDDEFADASALVQALGGVVRRGANGGSRQPSIEQMASPKQRDKQAPRIDRTIAVSPVTNGARSQPPVQGGTRTRSPERLSTVPEVESTEAMSEALSLTALSPPVSRLNSRTKTRRPSTASDKAAKRRVVEQAEELHRRSSASNRGNASGSNSRQGTPPEGTRAPAQNASRIIATEIMSDIFNAPAQYAPRAVVRESSVSTRAEDRREAVLKALDIITSISRGLQVPDGKHGGSGLAPWRLL
ncbi:hypothetical protein LTR08_005906 [Meristemomyces frigidus]|nr:hypothetical protein LTR08_005906 [Meristemomyces frigidus]